MIFIINKKTTNSVVLLCFSLYNNVFFITYKFYYMKSSN